MGQAVPVMPLPPFQEPGDPAVVSPLASRPASVPTAVPLVIGVVGHRDPLPEVVPQLRQAFRADLEQLLQALPHTPLLMLNGLASGMDCEAAEVFLAVCDADQRRRPDGQRHRLVAALPKPLQRYRSRDFPDPADRRRLDALLARCDAVLDPCGCTGLRGTPAAGEPLASPACYGQQGWFVVHHCHLLVAFHNGVETMAVGGTTQSVALHRGEVHPLAASLPEVWARREPGVLIEYDTPRRKNAAAQPRPPRSCWRGRRNRAFSRGGGPAAPAVLQLEDLLATPRRLEAINRALAGGIGSWGSGAARPASLGPCVAALAGRAERQELLLVAGLLLGGWGLSLLAPSAWAAPGVALLLAPLLLPRWPGGPRQRGIAYRSLEEGVALQELWADLGVERDAADQLRSAPHPPLDWVRTLLRAARIQRLACGAGRSPDTEAAAVRARDWMALSLAGLEQSLAHRRRRAAALPLLGLGLVAAAAAARGLSGGLATAAVLLLGRAAAGDRHAAVLERQRRDQLLRTLAAYEPTLALPPDDPRRLPRLRCLLEAVGIELLELRNDAVARLVPPSA